jgi:hypothetical protein
MTEKLSNPHDAFFKHYFSQPAVASDFLRQHLPQAISELLDLTQLRLEKDSFVDEKLRSYFSDLIYTTVTRSATPIRIALLAEHKSYPDEWVDFQVLRYKVGYWVQEFDALQASEAEAVGTGDKKERTPRRKTLTPILAVLVYHGTEAWHVELRFARHLTGMEDPNSKLSQVLGRYVPDFEPHFVNLSTLADEAIRGEMATRMMVTVLKYIFTEGLGGQLDEVLRLASHVLRQPSGLEMVMALLRYISRSAVKVDKTVITQKLLTYLPQAGGVLMETLAQEWIEEGKLIGKKEGIDIGKKEGIDIGEKRGKLVAQRQTLLHLLQWRFAPTPAEKERYAAQLEQVDNVEHLLQLVDQSADLAVLVESMFAQVPPSVQKPT